MKEIIAGDSYTFYVECYEDDAKTTPLDLTGLTSLEYKVWRNGMSRESDPLFQTSYGIELNIRIPDLTKGVIEVKLPSDLTTMEKGQYIHELILVDESGESIVLIREIINTIIYTEM